MDNVILHDSPLAAELLEGKQLPQCCHVCPLVDHRARRGTGKHPRVTNGPTHTTSLRAPELRASRPFDAAVTHTR
jgi:hypothetical protein